MTNSREYITSGYETSNSWENMTTELTIFPNISTTIIVTNTTISIPPNGLSAGAIAGIVIGTIVGVIGLFLVAFIIHKYRQRFIDMLHRDSKKPNNHSVQNKVDNTRPNITFAADHEYLTVKTSSSSRNQQSNEVNRYLSPRNQQPDENIYVNL